MSVQQDALAKARTENFPVAPRLLPRREHLLAVYAFARLVDDIGDEAPGDRNALLDAVEGDVDRIWHDSTPEYRELRPLAHSVQMLGLRQRPFRDLIEANRLDQTKHRYDTFDDLLGYCRLSANPVGRIVLDVLGVWTPERAVLSDLVCTGLQLAEHLQDVREDHANGRVYLPQDSLRRFGVEDLERDTRALRELIAFETRRARGLLDEGAAIVGTLRGRARLLVAGYASGGRAALQAIERAGYDVLSRTPKASKPSFARVFVSTAIRGR